ncbi:MAG: hypothetical protein U1E76_06480 [Planctomycetota bacterium]
MRSVIHGGFVLAVAAMSIAVSFAQSPTPGQALTKDNRNASASKDVVLLDASSTVAKLEQAPLPTRPSTIMGAPIDLKQLPSYQAGMDVVGFCISGNIENGNAAPAAGGETDSAREDAAKPTGALTGADQGLVFQAIIASEPELTREDIERLEHGTMDTGASGRGKQETEDQDTDRTDKEASRGSESAVVMCDCRILPNQLHNKVLSFEVIGVKTGGTPSANALAEAARRELTQRDQGRFDKDTARGHSRVEGTDGEKVALAKEGAARLSAMPAKPEDVAKALKLVANGKAYLYLHVCPSAGKRQHEAGEETGRERYGEPGSSSVQLTVKDLNVVFAASASK